METQSINNGFAKAVSSIVLTFAGLSWSEIAALLAACYTSLLILDWFWVRLWRPMFESRGWLTKKRMRVVYAETDRAPLS